MIYVIHIEQYIETIHIDKISPPLTITLKSKPNEREKNELEQSTRFLGVDRESLMKFRFVTAHKAAFFIRKA